MSRVTGALIILITGPVLGIIAVTLPLRHATTVIVNPVENAQRLEDQVRALEAVLEESSRTGADLSQSNDLSKINLDYDNTGSEDEINDGGQQNIGIAPPARVRRTIGRFYCSIFFRESPNECPLRRGGIRSLIFPSWSPKAVGQQSQANSIQQQPYKTENDFWLSYLQNNDTGLAVNFTTISQIPTTATTPQSVWGLGQGQRRPFGSNLVRRLFPRLSNAFAQGYRTGSGTGGNGIGNSDYSNGIPESNNLDSSNRNGQFSFLRALNPFRYFRNFLERRAESAGYQQ